MKILCYQEVVSGSLEALKHFHPYLYGVPFTIKIGHGSLRWLLNFKNTKGQLGRWSESLGSYNFKLIHRAGKVQHINTVTGLKLGNLKRI